MSDTSPENKAFATRRYYQPTFAAGELAPALYWRSDLAKWRAGAAELVNFIVTPQGGVARRSGTQFVCSAKDPTGTQWLIPFQFSTEQQYILEFGHHYIRFLAGGAYVMDGAAPYEISAPYDFPDLPLLRHVQSADVLTIVHQSYQQMELRRYGTLDWRLTPIAIGSQLPAPTGMTATAAYDTAVTGSPTPTDHTYEYAVTVSKFSGGTDESQISGSATCTNKDLGYYNEYGYRNELTWDASPISNVFYTVYRKYQGSWSKLGNTAETAFTDINYVPNTAAGPPTATNPFDGGNWPGTVGYYQERLVFGGSVAYPETMWFSKSGDYYNFDVSDPVKDDDALTYTLAARQVNQIRHILPLSDLMVMTGGGGWKVAASSSGAVTPSNIDVSPQSFVGASNVTPQIIGNRILYVEAKGSSVREIAYQFVQNQYVSQDQSVFSKHLLLGRSIVSWAWAEVPDKILWMVRDDGALLSLTYLPEQNDYAWAQHRTAAGLFKCVAVITETGDDGVAEDVPYFLVHRAAGNHVPFEAMIERMRTRRLGPNNDNPFYAWHVDCGLNYFGAPATVISGLDHLAPGTPVDYLADGVPGQAVVTSGRITLPVAASYVTVGLSAPAQMRTLPVDGPQAATDPWMGRRKHNYLVRIAVENTTGLLASVDGGAPAALIDPTTEAVPPLMFTGVLQALTGEGWTRDGQVSILCTTPLPATILGVGTEWGLGE